MEFSGRTGLSEMSSRYTGGTWFHESPIPNECTMSQHYTVRTGDGERGPFTAGQLKRMAAAGEIAPTDLVKREDGSTWHKAESVKGLFPEDGALAQDAPQPTPENDRQPAPGGAEVVALKVNLLCITSLALGLLAIPVCLLASLETVGVAVSGLGLILGLAGLLMVLLRGEASLPLALCGTCASGLALVLAGSMTALMIGGGSVHEGELASADPASAEAAADGPAVTGPPADEPMSAEPAPGAPGTGEPAAEEETPTRRPPPATRSTSDTIFCCEKARARADPERTAGGPPVDTAEATLKFLQEMVDAAVCAKYVSIRDGMWGANHQGPRSPSKFAESVQMPYEEIEAMIFEGIIRWPLVDPKVLEFFWLQLGHAALRAGHHEKLRQDLKDRLHVARSEAADSKGPAEAYEALEAALGANAIDQMFTEIARLRDLRYLGKKTEEFFVYLRATYGELGDAMVELIKLPNDEQKVLDEAKVLFEACYQLGWPNDGSKSAEEARIEPGKEGDTPLTQAREFKDIIEILDKGALLSGHEAARALLRACNMGQPFVVRYMLARKVRPNARIRVRADDYAEGTTALFEVVKGRGLLNEMIVKDLIAAGAHGRVETAGGETPMSIALRSKIRAPEILQRIEESWKGDEQPLVYHGWSGAVERLRSGFPWHKQFVSNTVYDAVLEPEEGKEGERRRARFVLDWGWQTRRAYGILRWSDTGTVTAIKTSLSNQGGLSITEVGLVARPEGNRHRYRTEHWTMMQREDGPGLAFRCSMSGRWQRIELKPSRDGRARGALPHTPRTWVSEASADEPTIRKDGIYAAEGGRGVNYIRFSTGSLVIIMSRRLSDGIDFKTAAAEDVQWILAGQERLRYKTAWAKSRGNRLSYEIYTGDSPLSPSTMDPRTWVFGEVHSNGDLTLREIDLAYGSVEELRYRFVPHSPDG